MNTNTMKEQYNAFMAARKEVTEKVDFQVELDKQTEVTVEISKQK